MARGRKHKGTKIVGSHKGHMGKKHHKKGGRKRGRGKR